MSVMDSRILKIPGHMYKDELLWIYARSCEVTDGGIVVEIGSFRGRSAAAWYQGVKDRAALWCIDPWSVDHPEGRPPDYQIFKEQMAMMGYRPSVLRMTSIEALRWFDDQGVDAVFIDGNHKVAGLDVDLWLPKVVPGGLLCGHDWRPGGVLEAEVLKRLPDAEHVKGSIWQWRKPL